MIKNLENLGLWRELRTWRYSSDPTSWRDLALETVHPLIPHPVRRLARAMRRKYDPYPWIAPSLVRETDLFDRLRQLPAETGPTLLLARVTIGADAVVGGHSLLGPGSRVPNGQAAPARTVLPPFWSLVGGRRVPDRDRADTRRILGVNR